MREMVQEITRGIVAIIVTVGGIYLMLRGVDTVVGAMLLAVVGFYFGESLFRRFRRR